MSIFVERFLLPCLVAAISFGIYQSKWDVQQKTSFAIGLVALAYCASHTLSKVRASSEVTSHTVTPAAPSSHDQIPEAQVPVIRQEPQVSDAPRAAAPSPKQSIAPAVTAKYPQKIPSVSAPSGIAIGGDNYGNPQVTNNYGPRPVPLLTVAQMNAVASAVRPFSGTKVAIAWEMGNSNVKTVVEQLKHTLEAGGLLVDSNGAIMSIMPDMNRIHGGISFSVKDADMPLVASIASTLQANGYTKPQDRFTVWPLPEDRPVSCVIYVGPPD